MYKILSQKPTLVKMAVLFISLLPGIISLGLILTHLFGLIALKLPENNQAGDPQVKALYDALEHLNTLAVETETNTSPGN